MADHTVSPPVEGAEVSADSLQSAVTRRIPQYRRNVFPANAVLSADDLADLCRIIDEANERAKNFEFNNLDLSKFESPEQARIKLDEVIQLEYNYVVANDDYVQGLGIPKVEDRSFPDELRSFFVSNASFTRRAINVEPLNVVDAFFSFAKPSLKIDLQTLPSNPTENKSVINIFGRDEDWVISTSSRIQDFLKQRKVFRPALHGSGTYDYFLYLVFLPAIIWLLLRWGPVNSWLDEQSVLLNVVLGIYLLLFSLLFARFSFQYFRWLFPPMEYYKKSRIGAYTHRIVAGALFTALILSASYDIVKSAILTLW